MLFGVGSAWWYYCALIMQVLSHRPLMSKYARVFGLIAAVAMGAFSAYIFLQTGDWVAAVFFIGSVGYAVVFVSTRSTVRQ